MTTINLNDYIAGGYFVARYATNGFWKSPLLPERIISLSSCISKTVNVYWGWDVEQHKAAILDFGISAEKLAGFKKWSNGHDIAHPNVFYTLNAAQQFIAEFLPDDQNLLLLGTALPVGLVNKFLTENPQMTGDSRGNLWESEPYGVHIGFHNRQPLLSGREIRGFEILCYGPHICDSWLCTNIEKQMHELYGIRPNQYGLIDTDEDAQMVNNWIAEHKEYAEPLPYYPWLIVQYPISANSSQTNI